MVLPYDGEGGHEEVSQNRVERVLEELLDETVEAEIARELQKSVGEHGKKQ